MVLEGGEMKEGKEEEREGEMSCSKLVAKLQKYLEIYNLSFACGNIPLVEGNIKLWRCR